MRLYLCGCGPIISDVLDLPGLAQRLAGEGVTYGGTHATLCSEQGRQWLETDLARHRGCGVVVAGCSVREHGRTFMEVCRRAGISPYRLALANIREQCTWVTPDPQQAATKAEALIRAAVSRAARQVPLVERQVECRTEVLVIGGGVAGMTAALLLADGDRQVTLVERTPVLGGRVAMLGDVFPGLECSSCLLQELMDSVLHHPRIDLALYSEVEEVVGTAGNFTVTVRRRARGVDPDACCGCGTCHEGCPVELDNQQFELGLSRRHAIYIPYPGALPSVSVIDREHCLRSAGQECAACAAVCPLGAVDLTGDDEIQELCVGGVILATGMTQAPDLDHPGPGRVLSAMALERLMNESGPTDGKLVLPGERGAPRSVALLHCADPRDAAADHCSRICCLNMAKFAHQIHHRAPGCKVYRFVRPHRGGIGGDLQLISGAAALPEVETINLQGSDLITSVEDLGDQVEIRYSRDGQPATLEVDLAVRALPIQGPLDNGRLSSLLHLDLDPRGFFLEEHERLCSFRTRREGVFLAGCAQGPRDIQEATAHGAAAAGAVLSALVPGRKLDLDPVTATVDAQRCGGCGTCVLACPYRAVILGEDGTAQVEELACRGCGTCSAGCPFAAVEARHFTDAQLRSEVEQLLGGGDPDGGDGS